MLSELVQLQLQMLKTIIVFFIIRTSYRLVYIYQVRTVITV